jgi:hypothetical protein
MRSLGVMKVAEVCSTIVPGQRCLMTLHTSMPLMSGM